ncbi:MAG: nucleoside triphosphate pyrophosphohydrolase [Verrucomicrobiota bacterium]
MIPAPDARQLPVDRLRKIVHLLRAPGGCPWDREQTNESLVPNLLEEAYEAAEAIQSGDMHHACEELGDLLLQVVIQSEIASETAAFTLDDVASGISEKLIRRHPHVFGDSDASDTETVLKKWDEIKAEEKAKAGKSENGVLDGVSHGLPALKRGQKLQKKAAKVGFDWPDVAGAFGKLKEEVAEVEEELARDQEDQAKLEEELGDVLFSVVNVIRKAGFDAESVLTKANAKFVERFGAMEEKLVSDGKTLENSNLETMEEAWVAVKK